MNHPKQEIVAYALIIGFILGICCSRHTPLAECNELIRQFDYGGARKILDRIVSSDSVNADALALLLRVYSLSNDTSAVDSLRNLLKASKSPIAKLSLGMFYYHNRYFNSADSQFTFLGAHNAYSRKAYEWSKLARKGQEADDLHNSAFQLLGQGQPDTAITIFSRADLIWKEINHVDARSATLCYRAFARATIGDTQGSETDIRESHRLAQMTGDRELQIRALTIWGAINDLKGNLKDALEKYQEAKKLALDHNSPREQIFVAGNMAITQAKMGDFLAAKETYLEVLSFSKKLNLERDLNISLQKLGDACKDLGQYQEAIKYYEESRGLAIKRTDPQLEAAALSGMSNVYFFQDNYEKAILLGLEANKIFNKINDKRNEVNGLITIAQIFNFMGQYDKAIQTAQQALQLAETLQAIDLIISAKSAIAQYYHNQDDFTNAIVTYEQILPLARETQHWQEVAEILIALTNCYRESKTIPASTTELEALIADAEARHLIYITEAGRLALARILAQKRGYTQAIDLFNKVIFSAQRIGDLELIAGANDGKGNVYRDLGKYQEAALAFTQATENLEKIANSLKVGTNRAGYYDRLRQITEKQIDLAYKLQQYSQIFELAEKAKARAFLGLMAQREFKLQNNPDSALIAKEQRLRRNVTNINSQLAENFAMASTETRNPVIERLSKELVTAQSEYSKFLYELELKNPRFNSVVAVPTIRLQDIRRILPANTLLLQHVVLDEHMLICALPATDDLRVFVVPYSREKLRDDVGLLHDQMQKKNLKEIVWRKMASHLGKVLLDSVKVAGLLTGVKTLIILPDDVLHYLPFQMLLVDQNFLVERFAVVNFPSASVMKLLSEQSTPTPRRRILAMAYSDGTIPFVEEEVKSIRNSLGNSVFPLIGKPATKDTLVKLASQYEVIHLAVHGMPSVRDPLLSALQLAPTTADDGKLFVHEVFDLHMQNSLIVLSACETGVEKTYQLGISAGGEVIGLVRAFLYAGASSVVSTLWKVDDEASAEFMRIFYLELQRAPNVSVALQKAQQALLSNAKFNHPYYWAPYISTGLN